MPRGYERDWESDDELLAIAGRHVGITAVADELGVHATTLRARLKSRGIREKFRAAHTAAPSSIVAEANADGVSREEILEAERNELRAALRKDRKSDVHRERIVQAVEQAVGAFAPAKRTTPSLKPPSEGAHHRQLLCLSDFHGGEIVEAEVVNDLNAYSWDIMEQRVDELIKSVLSHKRRSPDLTGLDIGFLGDMCSGDNHLELAVSNEMPLAVQAVSMGDLMGSIVERLAAHYVDVRCFAVEGNHPRLTVKPAAKSPENNMDWVAAQIASRYVQRIENVSQFTIGRGSTRWKIAGRSIYAFHGDGIRSSMPGVPFGGLMRRVNVIQAQYRDPIDIFLYGHFHTATLVQGGRIIGNGSLKGPDEWCLKQFGGGDAPAQWLLTFDEKRQRMTDARLVTPIAGIPA